MEGNKFALIGLLLITIIYMTGSNAEYQTYKQVSEQHNEQ